MNHIGGILEYTVSAAQNYGNQLNQHLMQIEQHNRLYDSRQLYHQGVGGIGLQNASQIPQAAIKPQSIIKPKEEKSMIKELRQDMQSFIKEHKSVIYWTLILYVVDHYCLEGAMKARLQKMVHNLVGKVEAKLDKATI